ncbi:MAG: hypothetical protein ACM3X3_11670 [Betaproteobacteria bacterium]
MPAVVAGYADADAVSLGAVYSTESAIAQASDQVTMSQSGYADVPGLTINLSLARPSGVIQIAQVDFKGTAWQTFGVQIACDSNTRKVTRAPRYSTYWQHLFLMWHWASLAAGSHTFKVQCTAGTIRNRKNILLVMRI